MSEQHPSKEAMEWVKGIAGWASKAPSGETMEEAERQFALRVDAFAAAAVARREAEIVARLEEMAKRCESDARVLARRGRSGANEMVAARAYRAAAEAIEDGDI